MLGSLAFSRSKSTTSPTMAARRRDRIRTFAPGKRSPKSHAAPQKWMKKETTWGTIIGAIAEMNASSMNHNKVKIKTVSDLQIQSRIVENRTV